MLKLIRYQLYRFFRSYSTYFAICGAMAFSIMLVGMNASYAYEFPEEFKITFFTTFLFDSTAFSMIYGVWSVVYSHGETGNGFIKQVVPLVTSKVKIFLSNLAVCGIMFLIMNAFVFAGTSFACLILIDGIALGSLSDYIINLLVELILHLALASFGMTIIYLVKNFFASIIMIFVVVMGMDTIIIPPVEDFINKTLGFKDVCICKASFLNNVMNISLAVDNKEPLLDIILPPLILLVVYTITASVSISKRDVK